MIHSTTDSGVHADDEQSSIDFAFENQKSILDFLSIIKKSISEYMKPQNTNYYQENGI